MKRMERERHILVMSNESAYWDLYSRAVGALHEARLAEAEVTFLEARQEAENQGISSLADRAYCNWAAVRVETGKPAGLREGLSRVLGQSPDAKARQLSAYHLAVLYDSQDQPRAADLYAEMSSRMADSLQDPQGRASSSHLLGLMQLRDGRLNLAEEHLRASLGISMKAGLYLHSLITMSALGYGLSLAGSPHGSLWMLEEVEAALGTPGWKLYEPSVRLNLGFSYLETGDFEESIEQGRAALASMERQGLLADKKFAYYLLGEGHARKESGEEAKAWFDILQQSFYPQYPELAETLLDVRTSRWLNWLGR